MEARYAFRKSPLLDEWQIAPEIFEQGIPRLSAFMKPFVTPFQGRAADHHTTTSVCGLLSDVERNNIASIASRLGQSRLPLQAFIGWDAWDDAPLRQELLSQEFLAAGNPVLSIDTKKKEVLGTYLFNNLWYC